MVKSVMIVGVGGQGTLLASRIIAKTALNSGCDVKISEVHGMAQRGGSVVTFVRFGDKVYEPVIEPGCADVIIAFEKLEALRYAHYLKKEGVIIVNDCAIAPMPVVIGAEKYPENIIEKLKSEHEVFAFDGQKITSALRNPKVLNIAILGYSATKIGFILEDWLLAVESSVPNKTIEVNKEAFTLGYKSSDQGGLLL